ncbi:glycosyltransferase family 4 protein [Clostridium sp. 19966]|uniref:glycosyltransferase family 4 protein n=1 Tax=Clostridium sp. 19966 TaxID=2768166 RepID=UPI0028DDE02E|nr:glycosyltransferase family 1 protein [Clostridium sp. 19966]MDT8716158.1 glycosyltransferase family 4 protein [Clostridium sp. 19966]
MKNLKDIIIDARMVTHQLHGIGRYTYELIKRVSSTSELNLKLLVNDVNLGKEIFGEFKNVEFIVMKSKFISLQEQIELPRVINRYKGKAIFHSPSFVGSPFIKINTIMTIHDLNHLRFPQFYSPFHKYYYKFIVKTSARKTAKLLTGSEFAKDELLEWLECDESKIVVAYDGIDKRFSLIEDKDKLESVRKKYKLPDRFILYIGNQKPHKNVETIISSMKYIDEVKFVINGKGNESINKAISDNKVEDKILKIGFVDEEDLPYVYNLATVFTFPSLYEGFGLPPLEAMACGCPTVVSNTSSLPEVVGEAALKVEAKDDKAFADAINQLLTDEKLRENLIQSGMERVKKFSWDKMVEDTIKVYMEAMN